MRVKICGLTNLEDALAAIEAGADFLGFNFYAASPRYISPAECASLVAALQRFRPEVGMVGVFVGADPEQIECILDDCSLDFAQLSGNEPPGTMQRLGQHALKALRAADSQTMEKLIQNYPPRSNPPAYLIDAYRPGEYGGTGYTANWRLAASLAIQYPLLLAGGLTPENVADAIRQVRPWGVDVASGVEISPRQKDVVKMQAFIAMARKAMGDNLDHGAYGGIIDKMEIDNA